ncbi:Ig-like domain-containing protein [Hymenobacter sp. 5516J-16]|uniref:Ig-like domain-containing protein n=1 Tax=Hymenobacter sp. 5516J-16 TaxID=2932253 RepID=UPI001FD361BA|nr:Ig-like domain-containing protein [Hymenobacter sp. 5516J-16]UOQ79041.1 Ig-like domain-containing protein [Hymenobacter sp. 5516J-16]
MKTHFRNAFPAKWASQVPIRRVGGLLGMLLALPATTWAAAPVANNDAAVVVITATSATINILANDTRGGLGLGSDAIDPATVRLIGATAGTSNIAGSNGGLFSVSSSGVVTFTLPTNPKPSTRFQTSIRYTVRDVTAGLGDGTSNEATLTVTVSSPPLASNVRAALMPSSAAATPIAGLVGSVAAGNTLSGYTLKSLPNNGTLYLNTTAIGTAPRTLSVAEAAQLQFDPAGNKSGEFTFTYTATNNDGLESAPATYTIPVANVPPVAVNDPAVIIARNGIATISVLTNDTDADGSILATTVDLNPDLAGIQQERTMANQGKFTVSAQGIVSFTPVLDYAGTSTITYTVEDNLGLTSNQAAIRVIVNNITSAFDDSNEVEKGMTVSGNVILNDTDPQNTGFTVALVTGVKNGSLALNANGSYTYTPTAGFLGQDSFVYRACDKTGTPQCATATVHLNVYDPAVQCIAATGPNQLVNPGFTNGNVGFNTNYEYKADDAAVATELTPENTYAIGPDASKYHGTFRGNGRGGAADNFLMINATSAIRTLYTQTFKVQPNRYYTFSAFFNNLIPANMNIADPIVGFVINGESTSGTITVPESPDQWVQYSDVWYSGNSTTATFEIRNLTLDLQGNDIGIDDLYFGTCNAVPVANNTAATPLAATATATALAPMDATDPDGTIASFTITALPLPAAGTLYVNGVAATLNQVVTPDDNKRLTFDPSGAVNGNVTFTFLATDNIGSTSNTATYTIPVGNTAPLAANVLMAPAIPNTAAATTLKPLVATDGDGTIVKYMVVTVPNQQAGTLLLSGTPVTTIPLEVQPAQLGQLAFDPSGAYAGPVTFNYYAVDNQGNTSNTAIYTIPIGNEMPVAKDKWAQGMRNTTNSTPLSALESTDADGWIASYTIANLPSRGALTLNGVAVSPGQTIRPEQASELAYAPPKTETGQYSFTYYATDNLGGTSNLATYVVPVAGPLPVKMLSFTTQLTGTTAQLTWTTAAELNNDRFEVERSLDGKQFQRIGQVRGLGTSATGATYRFTDAALPTPGAAALLYYRLKQVDVTGESAYSQVRTVALAAGGSFVVAVTPNPFSSEASLNLLALPTAAYQVVVTDATGRQVYGATLGGGQVWPLAVSSWPAGFYTVVVRGANTRFIQRIVKQ